NKRRDPSRGTVYLESLASWGGGREGSGTGPEPTDPHRLRVPSHGPLKFCQPGVINHLVNLGKGKYLPAGRDQQRLHVGYPDTEPAPGDARNNIEGLPALALSLVTDLGK